MELEVLGTFYFVLCYKSSYFGKVAMLMTLIFFDFPHQVIQLISLAACIKKIKWLHLGCLYYFVKEKCL